MSKKESITWETILIILLSLVILSFAKQNVDLKERIEQFEKTPRCEDYGYMGYSSSTINRGMLTFDCTEFPKGER